MWAGLKLDSPIERALPAAWMVSREMVSEETLAVLQLH